MDYIPLTPEQSRACHAPAFKRETINADFVRYGASAEPTLVITESSPLGVSPYTEDDVRMPWDTAVKFRDYLNKTVPADQGAPPAFANPWFTQMYDIGKEVKLLFAPSVPLSESALCIHRQVDGRDQYVELTRADLDNLRQVLNQLDNDATTS